MKFICTKENFSNILDLVTGISGKQTNLPILNNLLIQVSDSKVEIISTDLEIAIKVILRAKVESEGSFTVPAKTLADYVRLISEEQIEVELVGNELIVRAGSSSTKIKGMSSEEFPVIPNIEEEHSYLIDADTLRKSLNRAVVAVAKNEIRPELSGVYFSFFSERYTGLILAATDSYRLAECKVPVKQGSDEFTCIVPAKTAVEIIKLLSLSKGESSETGVRMWLSQGQIAIRYGNFEMTSRLIEGRYPNYSQIIPTEFKTSALFPSDVMIKKIKAASLFTTIGVNAVTFSVNSKDSVVGIASASSQTGEHSSTVDSEVKGDNNSILLNFRYVQDGLQQIEENNVEFKMNSADSPCLFRAKEKDEYLYIVMPIRQ